jgi:hypothetical protein
MIQSMQSADPLANLSSQARNQLSAASHTPFSREGFDAVQEQVDKYIGDIILESVRIMERRQADTVSRRYVQQAGENLVASSRRRLFTLIGTIGGIFFGTAASSFFEMARSGKSSLTEALVASLFGVAGAFMIALQFTRE